MIEPSQPKTGSRSLTEAERLEEAWMIERGGQPKHEFRSLTEAEVRDALKNPASPVAVEVRRLIADYNKSFREALVAMVLKYGESWDDGERVPREPGRWPIEEVVMELIAEADPDLYGIPAK